MFSHPLVQDVNRPRRDVRLLGSEDRHQELARRCCRVHIVGMNLLLDGIILRTVRSSRVAGVRWQFHGQTQHHLADNCVVVLVSGQDFAQSVGEEICDAQENRLVVSNAILPQSFDVRIEMRRLNQIFGLPVDEPHACALPRKG
jgi:hypothetical protein